MIHQKITHVFVLLTVALMLSGCEQARVDAQMEELCKRDGGIKIYEKISLPKEDFDQGGVPTLFNGWNQTQSGYMFVSKFEEIKSSKPTLSKTTASIIRERDGKALGTYIYYTRIGGLILTLGSDPARNCPSNARESIFLKTIFVQSN